MASADGMVRRNLDFGILRAVTLRLVTVRRHWPTYVFGHRLVLPLLRGQNNDLHVQGESALTCVHWNVIAKER